MLEMFVKPSRRQRGVFKSTNANAERRKLLAEDGGQQRSRTRDSGSQTLSASLRSSRGRGEGHKTYKLPSAGIGASAFSKRLFDPAAYIDITGVDELQDHAPTFTPRIGLVNTLQLPTPTGSESSPSSVENSVFSIELPPVNLSREEYLECADALCAPQGVSIPSQVPDGLADSRDAPATNLDRRQEAYAALDALERLLQSVFAAVGQALGHESGFEHIVTLTTEQEAIMTAATQEKMHDAINKVVGLRCLHFVSLENLLWILKLSEASMKRVDGLEARADKSWDDTAVESWIQRLSEVEVALKAAQTCARILCGGRPEKQLYSESVINRCVDIFKNVTEGIIIPLVELRKSKSSANLFKVAQRHNIVSARVVVCCQKLFAVLKELATKIELSEAVINTLELTALEVVFVENACIERDSAVGAGVFDSFRSVAVDMLCQIFLIEPNRRQGIIDDILISLEKFPAAKQCHKEFKLDGGCSIQPVSGLIMRLVQASSNLVSTGGRSHAAFLRGVGDDGDVAYDELRAAKNGQAMEINLREEQAAYHHAATIQELEAVAEPLRAHASRTASYIINVMVKRAVGSTKTGDTPYRSVLDLFVEDLTTCLGSPDWPSAEFLLRLLMVMMVQLIQAPKHAAPAKNMALELLGTICAAISLLRSHVRETASEFRATGAGELSECLSDLATQALENNCQSEQIVAWSGPFRATLEYIQCQYAGNSHLTSAVPFVVADWSGKIHSAYNCVQEDDTERKQELGRLAYRLKTMVENKDWRRNDYTFIEVVESQARLAFSTIVLRSPLCELFSKILNILLSSMASDQATVRNKSLKSVTQVLETDPSVLDSDSTVVQLILDCSSDPSPQVRDSALILLGKCIVMRPSLEPSLTPKIIDRFQDATVIVRKRAMKLAGDIYLHNRNTVLQSAIANGLLRRAQDPDEGVRNLARQVIEQIWFAPFYPNKSTQASETALTEHVALVVRTMKTGAVEGILDKTFRIFVSPSNRSLKSIFTVCSRLVDIMFGLIGNPESEDTSDPSCRDTLQALTIFAKADPGLFTLEQIRRLKPHLAAFTNRNELTTFRAATVIYKRVLPRLPTIPSGFLAELRLQLLKAMRRVRSRGALDDLIDCTSTVCELLKDSSPLANLVASCLLKIQELGGVPLDCKRLNHFCAYAIIVGSIGRRCDLDRQLHILRVKFPRWQFASAPRLIVDTLLPFALSSQSLKARRAAIEAIGLVCQSWPRNYLLAEVVTAFQQVFQDRNPFLEHAILRSFKGFLMAEEQRSEADVAAVATVGNGKGLTIMGGTGFDDVASAITQSFFNDITRIALESQSEHAFLALEVLGSITRQGLTHPKDTAVTLITLETSTNRNIAEFAFMEHRSLHQKHETVLEREYAKAVQSVYTYQRDVVEDSHGATVDPFQSKLHLLMEVLKISKLKNRQRFLVKFCNLADFELSKIETTGEVPPHVDFARFIVENLAFFEYQTVGETQTVADTLGKIVTATGATVAQAIESEMFRLRVDSDEVSRPQGSIEPEPVAAMSTADLAMAGPLAIAELPDLALPIEPQRLRQLATASIVLLSLWEARVCLRKLYNISSNWHGTKAKVLARDLNQAPTMTQGVHGDKFRDAMASHMGGLQTEETMLKTCRLLVELMNVGGDLAVAYAHQGPSALSGKQNDNRLEESRKRNASVTPNKHKERARTTSRPRKRRCKSVAESSEDEPDGDWI